MTMSLLFESLPYHLLDHIFTKLDFQSLLNARLVSTKLCDYIDHNWHRLPKRSIELIVSRPNTADREEFLIEYMFSDFPLKYRLNIIIDRESDCCTEEWKEPWKWDTQIDRRCNCKRNWHANYLHAKDGVMVAEHVLDIVSDKTKLVSICLENLSQDEAYRIARRCARLGFSPQSLYLIVDRKYSKMDKILRNFGPSREIHFSIRDKSNLPSEFFSSTTVRNVNVLHVELTTREVNLSNMLVGIFAESMINVDDDAIKSLKNEEFFCALQLSINEGTINEMLLEYMSGARWTTVAKCSNRCQRLFSVGIKANFNMDAALFDISNKKVTDQMGHDRYVIDPQNGELLVVEFYSRRIWISKTSTTCQCCPKQEG